MLKITEVRAAVVAEIEALLLEEDEDTAQVRGTARLHDIGLNSLMLARLIVQLEGVVGGDPFVAGLAEIADVRTVDDLVAAYERVAGALGVPVGSPS
ncbi:phosphopantetheine-binding protein [Actinoplanes sp. L3-i22]|uniref:phosphopantetheine-binding protein n=1 Tax=Actinoplanes sp. L3-i22 TaxID=2836373 RepID=UPI001C75DEC2|nr:phosphopantetheine-binding protein [Actinoplanes sp. L3-i22]BCY08846.1 hypothetical protein L3i22_039340 [Actinoplanes sp. L3-i22]